MKHGQMPQLLERIRNALYAEGIYQNCTNCMYWNEKNELCKLYNQRPPARVIVHGCDSFDEIPF